MKIRAFLCVACLSFLVAGCGGDGGNSDSPPTDPPPTQNDAQNAADARLTASLNSQTKLLTLTWRDTFEEGTRYRVEASPPGGAFQEIETISGAGGNNTTLEWSRQITSNAIYRVVAVLTGRTVPLKAEDGSEAVAVQIPISPPEIVLVQAEPVWGKVAFSLSNLNGTYRVSWYVDGDLIGIVNSHDAAIEWDSDTVPNGQHTITARLQLSSGAITELQRTVATNNVDLITYSTVSGLAADFPTLLINVRASSEFGIKKVEVFFDGQPLPVLYEPNVCTKYCYPGDGDPNDVYRHEVGKRAAGSGLHTVLIVVTDNANRIDRRTLNVKVSITDKIGPSITLLTPGPGETELSGILNISGYLTSDQPEESLRVSASISGVPFMDVTGAEFSGQYDMTGLTPGQTYVLSINAQDALGRRTSTQRNIKVLSEK